MLAIAYEKELNIDLLHDILDEMNRMRTSVQKYFDSRFKDVFCEIEEILKSILQKESIDMKKYPNFFSAFGRTQQYISFVKK